MADSLIGKGTLYREIFQKTSFLFNPKSLGYERVYLPLCEVADIPFHIQVVNSMNMGRPQMASLKEVISILESYFYSAVYSKL